MSDTSLPDDRPKKERSPSYPFISLRKAVERAEQFMHVHREDAARISAVATTWGYTPKSSGLLQTAAALKAYGLVEEVGAAGDERKIRLTDLARKIIDDPRPGVRESALVQAARGPKLFAEYFERWGATDMPSDSHVIAELVHDRGFTKEAAKLFLKSYRLTVSFAGLLARGKASDTSDMSDDEEEEGGALMEHTEAAISAKSPSTTLTSAGAFAAISPTQPFAARCKVEMTPTALSVGAKLLTVAEVDVLIRILEANKALLGDTPDLGLFG